MVPKAAYTAIFIMLIRERKKKHIKIQIMKDVQDAYEVASRIMVQT